MLGLAMRGIIFLFGVLLVNIGCGGSQEPTKLPDAEDDDIQVPDEPTPEPKSDEGAEGGEGEGGKGEAKAPAGDPEFKDGMSVDEAISAVPQGTPRVNVDQEELGKPLVNEAL